MVTHWRDCLEAKSGGRDARFRRLWRSYHYLARSDNIYVYRFEPGLS